VRDLPASLGNVAAYVADVAKAGKFGAINPRVAAISAVHRASGYSSPTKAKVVRVARREARRMAEGPEHEARPATAPDLSRMVEGFGSDLAGCRGRALVLLGFAGALRRNELVGLDVADITEETGGLTVRLRSKADRSGGGRTVGIPGGTNRAICPIRAWRTWLEVSHITEGPAFRPVGRHGHVGATRLTSQAVALLLKRHVGPAALDRAKLAARH
jgi:integrase